MPGRRQAALLALAVAVLAAATALAWGRGDGGGPAAPAGRAAVADGAAIFRTKGCAVCHLAKGAADGYGIGPDLRGLPATAGSRAPGMSAEAYVRQSILDPGAFPPGGEEGFEAMPTLPVSPAELDALVAYLLADAG